MDRWEWLKQNMESGRVRIDPETVRLIEDQRRIEAVTGQVRAMRKAQHLTQVELARKVGSTQASISRFEAGKIQDVGFLFVRRILDVLGAT